MRLNIENPCPEKWENMQKLEGGAFCSVCNKKVHDFTKTDAANIQTILRKNAENNLSTCGKISIPQLFDFNFEGFFHRFNLWRLTKKIAVVIFFGFGLSLFSCSGGATGTVGKLVPEENADLTDSTETVTKNNNDSLQTTPPKIERINNVNFVPPIITSSDTETVHQNEEIVQENKNHPPPLPLAPSYKGGRTAMEKIVSTNVKMPAEALKANVKGTVFVKFIVTASGQTKNFSVQNPLGYGCDEEAIRVAKLLKYWNPGKMNGKSADMECGVAVSFGQ